MLRKPRTAVVFTGDTRDPTAWSGSAKGLTDALVEIGADVRRVSAASPPFLHRAFARVPRLHPERCRLQSTIAQARLRACGPLDAVVQIGREFTIRTAVATATFEDMTVVQHERYGDEWFGGFPPRARRAWKRRQQQAYTNATACCVLPQRAADSVIHDYGVPPAKVHALGLGADHLVPPPEARDWSVPRFLIVARDWRRKNVALVIETFTALRKEQPCATLDVVGPYPGPGAAGVTLHGPLRLSVEQERRQVEDLFRNDTCYVMPSTHEAAGMTFIEAATAGMASIGTTVGGVRELIGDGGVVVDPTDRAALLDAMRRVSYPETAPSSARGPAGTWSGTRGPRPPSASCGLSVWGRVSGTVARR
jgi:glycosyltransferase involved in cell wall biosynthesis